MVCSVLSAIAHRETTHLGNPTSTTRAVMNTVKRIRFCTTVAGVIAGNLALSGAPVWAAADPPPGAGTASVTNEELLRKLEAMEEQNRVLAQKVERLEAAQARASGAQAAIPVETATPAPSQVAGGPAYPTASSESSTTIGAYGEINYTRPSKLPSDANVDVARAVILLQHQFDEKTRFGSEFEWEHAVTSEDDGGEAEVEQLWLERDLTQNLRARAGLMLMPVGLVNENHEPNAFYGVQRPEVDTKIVPSTWREVGLGVLGDTPGGLSYQVAVTSAPNLSNWDPASTEGLLRGPLQATHQEGQFATVRDGGVIGALNWRGIPGLLVGGSAFYAWIGQHQPDFPAGNARLLFLDAHARYEIAGWEFAGEYERGTISNTEALNASYAASSTPNPTLVPHLFYGGYVQAAYRLWQHGAFTFQPFARYEILNTAAGFGSLPVSAGGIVGPDEVIWTLGGTLRIGEGVVLKADYRHYKENPNPDPDHFNLGNSLNLGLGFEF
jgi:hypothetical protein